MKAHRIAQWVSAGTVAVLLAGVPAALAQDAGYEPPEIIPTSAETQSPSEPPATIPPGPVPSEALAPPVAAPSPGLPTLPATGIVIASGLALAMGLLAGGASLLRIRRRSKGT